MILLLLFLLPLSETLAVVLGRGREGEGRKRESQRKLAMDKDGGRSGFFEGLNLPFLWLRCDG